MKLSLNEIEALSRKAARGAGMPWGLAEDAGKAVRWLCAAGGDGATELARLLDLRDATIAADWSPAITGADWTPTTQLLCPIITGTALSDRAEMLASESVTCHRVAQPLLLLPFAAAVARHLKVPLSVTCDAVTCEVSKDGYLHSAQAPAVADLVTFRRASDMGDLPARRTRATMTDDAFSILNTFAARTYAPATEASRLKGAGAGTTDND